MDSIYDLADKINKEVDSVTTYVTDMSLYNEEDHWERVSLNPEATKGLLEGDCEDYALEKRYRLWKAGVPLEKMRMCICTTEDGGGHAVLVVDSEKGDIILDQRQNGHLTTKTELEQHGYHFLAIQKPGSGEWIDLTLIA